MKFIVITVKQPTLVNQNRHGNGNQINTKDL